MLAQRVLGVTFAERTATITKSTRRHAVGYENSASNKTHVVEHDACLGLNKMARLRPLDSADAVGTQPWIFSRNVLPRSLELKVVIEHLIGIQRHVPIVDL